MMEISVTFLLTGCLIQGALCGFDISLPKKVEALKGSCVFIPCTFDVDQEYEKYLTDNAKRKWHKDETPLTEVFNSDQPNAGSLKGEIFGTPTDKNCTTHFHNVRQSDNGSYFFRVESGQLKYSYRKPTFTQVEIAVIGSPPKPKVSLLKDQQNVTEVEEGSSVNLRCSTKIFCSSRPANLTWSSSPEHLLDESVTQQQRQEQTELISDLIFTVTPRHHSANFTCSVTHQLRQQITKNKTRTLRVQYAPKNTSAHVTGSGFVVEGRSVTLSCSSDANPPVLNYTWYRDTEEPLKPVQSGQNLTISNTDPTHSGRYVCTAQNEQGTQNASVMLDVQYAPKNTSAHVTGSGFVVEGRSVTLSCSSDANPPVLNYTWYRDTEEPLKPVQSGQNLTISNTDPTHSGRYVCTAQNEHGTQNASVTLNVQFAPKISSFCKSSVITCVCEAHGNPSPKLEWHLSGNVLANTTNTVIWNETLGSTSSKSVLIIHRHLTETDVLLCFSANTLGTASASFHPIAQTLTNFHQQSVLLGAAVGASAMMILCIIAVYNERRRNPKPSGTRQDDTSGLILSQTATVPNGDEVVVYENKDMQSAITPRTAESLHYSSIVFTNAEPASGEIWGASSLTEVYAVVRRHSAGDAASATDLEKDQSPQDSREKITDGSSEDMIYENMTHRLVV
ncbi:B-cell receptor CD22-like isoform X2 [Pimephales promelas]|uniref:B-cell receptor CD22-like isoform X2 n=1 Tax=Pimephales promelas TaxID=90988 RepID=UPI0019557E10|nr:B-cell receptor CD22-like isoform X2 [Pimephales promelas]